MIAELGLAALWLAAALAALQLIAGFLAARQNEQGGELAILVRPAAIVRGPEFVNVGVVIDCEIVKLPPLTSIDPLLT